MKHIYFYSWVVLAYLFVLFSKVAAPVVRFLVSIFKLNKENHAIWKKDLYNNFLNPEGGMIDRGAWALTLIFMFSLLGVLTTTFNLTLFFFEPQWKFGALLVLFAGFSYYMIYFRSRKWLTRKIKKVSKKLYP